MDGERERVKIEYQPANEYVAVRMRGNYMKNAGIIDGSLLIVHMQRYYDNGDIILFARAVNGKLQTFLRRVKMVGNAVLLITEGDGELTTPEEGDFVIGVVVEVKTYIRKKYAA